MQADTIRGRIRHRENMFLRRLFAILAKMAKIDGRVDPWETHAAERAFALFPRANARRKFCVSGFNAAKNGRKTLRELAVEFAQEWATPEDCLVVYELLWDIACARDVLRPTHKNALRDLCEPLGLPPNYFKIFYRRRSASFREVDAEAPHADSGMNSNSRRRSSSHRGEKRRNEKGTHQNDVNSCPGDSLYDAYRILGCNPSDPADVVRRAYRSAAKRNHPDLLRARGCSEREIRKATESMSRINAAWEKIRESRKL